MKIAWLLLLSILCLYLCDEVQAWRRFRIRVRRVVPRVRVRRIARVVRRVVPRVRVRRIVRLPRIRLRKLVRLPRIGLRRLVRLPSIGKIVGIPILDKFIKLPKIGFRLRRIFRRRRPPPPTNPEPTLPPALAEPGPEPEPTLSPCPTICAGNCPDKCSSWNCPCQWVCPSTCELFTKEEFLWPYNGFPAPLPCDFSQYDADKDNLISPGELAYQVRRRARDDNNMFVFNKMDADRDGNLTPDEFDSLLLLKDCDEITSGNATTPAVG